MEKNQKKLVKDGSNFKRFPAMKVAKIYSSNRSFEDQKMISPWTNKPVYKKLVEIALPQLNAQFNESIWIDDLLSSQTEIDWGIQIKGHVLDQAADVLFVTGLLYGDIHYESKIERKQYLRKIALSWKSSSKLSYTYPPLKDKSDFKAIHLFKSPLNQTLKHQTQYIHETSETACELIKAEVTSSEEIEPQERKSCIHLFVNAELSLRLLQNQMTSL